MTRHIILDDDLYRIMLDDGEWIDILEQCTNSIRRKAQDAALNAKSQLITGSKTGTAPIEVSFSAGEFNRTLLYEMIKAWSFTDKQGKPIPMTPGNIDRLSEDDSNLVLKKIDELNPARGADEKKTSNTRSITL